MNIESIHISGVGGIEDLTVVFNPQMNIICGPNGIGKTTLLESIAHCFVAGETDILKRHVTSNESRIIAKFWHDGNPGQAHLAFSTFEPSARAQMTGVHKLSQYVLSLKTTRTFAYVPLTSVSRDTQKPEPVLWQELKVGVSLADLKNWFVNRYLYSAHEYALSSEKLSNFELAKQCFSALNPAFSFSRVDAPTNEIMVNTPAGEIYYEYLSSGFKSCLSILFGIMKEIEFRFPETQMLAQDFAGLVLVDEIEMHLHPEWQYRIPKVLKQIFPKVQFIVTTHSPHVIQSADPYEIIALEEQDGVVFMREVPVSSFGFKGWTVDEVLTDVMGMNDTRTLEFHALMQRFTDAVDKDNSAVALEAFKPLDAILHPSSHVRKLLRLQLASVVERVDD